MTNPTLIQYSGTASKRKSSFLSGTGSTVLEDKAFIKKPRLGKKKAATMPAFTIFEDDTATKAANPTPEEIKNDPEYSGFTDQSTISRYTAMIRSFTIEYVGRKSAQYAIYVAHYLLDSAKYLDGRMPYTGPGLERRLCNWTISQISIYEYAWHQNEEEGDYLPVEMLEDLANIVTDIFNTEKLYAMHYGSPDSVDEYREAWMRKNQKKLIIVTGFCLGRGVGFDVGNPAMGDYLEDGRRNPDYYKRLAVAWETIFGRHLGEKHRPYWGRPMRPLKWWIKKMKLELSREKQAVELPDVDWRVMEHYWGDSYPPSGAIRTFGQEVNRIGDDDIYREDDFQRGLENVYADYY